MNIIQLRAFHMNTTNTDLRIKNHTKRNQPNAIDLIAECTAKQIDG